jgi:nucleoside-diphosphate-sugar epimerase
MAEQEDEVLSKQRLESMESEMDKPDFDKGVVLVTGGTGFLGKVLIQELRGRGWPVRVVARRTPASRDKVPGIEYVEGDIAEMLPDEYFKDVGAIAHLAAETAGGQEAHERNTIQATKYLLEAAGKHDIKQFINISSIAVHKPSSEIGHAIDEDSPVDHDNIGRGPYVWGKAKAEQLAQDMSAELGFEAKTIRLGPLVDFQDFTPPGRLGREVGPLFVIMGNPGDKLSVCDVRTASNVIRYYVEKFEDAPSVLNLVEADAPSRSELYKMIKTKRQELKAFWMFTPLLKLVSLMLKLLLKLLKPGKKPLDVYAAFATEKYNASRAAQIIAKARSSS